MMKLASPRIASLLALVMAAFAAPAHADDLKIKNGETIVFLGDSITQAGAGPKGYVTLIREQLDKDHPDAKIQVIGAGISGNKVPDLQGRLDKDVLGRSPSLVVIYIGINDVWHGEKDPAKGTTPEKFEAGLKEIIKKCKDSGSKVMLCTPSVIGEKADGSNNLDKKLDEYSEISRKVAKETDVHLCDLRKAFLTYEKEHNPENKESGLLTSDRVHLNEAGNKFVAETMLKCMGEKK
jgi:lysophospholipase L1-like esterase